MNGFYNSLKSLYKEFGSYKHMVLSTSLNNRVSSRMMSVVLIDGLFYFQTDKTFKKYNQLLSNPNAAFCCENISVEGVCKLKGKPVDNKKFCELYEKYFPKSYELYTNLDNEVLFSLEPVLIERWIYEQGIPYLEKWEFETEKYEKEEYIAGE